MADESGAVADPPRTLREAIRRRNAVKNLTPAYTVEPPGSGALALPGAVARAVADVAPLLDLPTAPARDPEVRALELARVQCTPGEIAAVLAHELGWGPDEAAAFVADHAHEVLDAAMLGRAELRTYLWNLSFANDPKLGKYATNTTLAAAMLLGRQHLGYTQDGLDAKVRRKMEQLERAAAHAAARNRGQESDGG
jgi:hypothetical protein